MNSKHRKTLAAVFAAKIPKSLPFRDIESLLIGLGCGMVEGRGSRVFFHMNEYRLDLHRPHPGKDALEYQVRLIRTFLKKLGVEP